MSEDADEKRKHSYRCELGLLVRCYLDCQTWLEVIRDARRDEEGHTSGRRYLYGVDYCDLAPYVARATSDHVYSVSRAQMVSALLQAQWGQPRVVVPPATLIEYIQGVLSTRPRFARYVDALEELERTKDPDEFQKHSVRLYGELRQLLQAGTDVVGLEELRTLFDEGTLHTLDDAVASGPIWQKILASEVVPDEAGFELLRQRRRGDAFSARVDMCNWRLFLAAHDVLRDHDMLVQMTTSGNLTLEAFRRSAQWLSREDQPGRHLATPYVRVMIRQDEDSKAARVRKLTIGENVLQEILAETLDVPSAKAVIERADIRSFKSSSSVWVSERMYHAIRTWQALFFFPYIKRLRIPDREDIPDEGEDISHAVDWTRRHKEEIKRRAEEASKATRKAITQIGGFENQNVRERFVPQHREAEKILDWLTA